MSRFQNNGSTYRVIANGPIRQALRDLQVRAAELGIGPALLTALKTMNNWLRHDPLAFGEPGYHLYKARLQVRSGVIPPLIIHYAVHQDQPLVFIKGVALMSNYPPTS